MMITTTRGIAQKLCKDVPDTTALPCNLINPKTTMYVVLIPDEYAEKLIESIGGK